MSEITELRIVPVNEIPMGEAVPLNDLHEVDRICRLLANLCEAENGIGISAVQAGIPWNLFLIRTGNLYSRFLNCYYTVPADSRPFASKEGCLSLRDADGRCIEYVVPRHPVIKIFGVQFMNDLSLREINGYTPPDDLLNIVFQHEIDHAYGRLISDIGK